MNLNPLCPNCGFSLVAKIGTKIVVCVLCNSEYDLIKKQQGLDAFFYGNKQKFDFKKNELSYNNSRGWA